MSPQQEADILLAEHQAARPERKPRLIRCEECGVNPADLPSRICVGCDAYREHTGAF